MNKKFVWMLVIVLVIVWVVNDLRQSQQGEFEKAFEYSFEEKSYQEIEDNLIRQSEHYMRPRSDTDQIFSLVNMMECRHYLLYENRYSLKKYYDFIKVILYPDLRFGLKNKKKYSDEIGKFLRRKRKIKIKYLKYEVSRPLVSKEGTIESAQVFLIRTAKADKEYLKYDFKKHADGRYYLYVTNKILRNQLKFKFKVKEKE